MSQDNEGHMIFCSRCGAEMKSNSRYCMKCGNLNYEHKDNERMRAYIQESASDFEVSGGKYLGGSALQKKKNNAILVGDKMGSPLVLFALVYGFYLVGLLFSLALIYLSGANSLVSIASSAFPIIVIICTLLAFFGYACALLFMKCNKPWWASFIPIYNIMVLSDIVFGKPIVGLVSFIPGINLLFFLILFYRLGTMFRTSGFLMVLFPYIMIPVVAFGHSSYKGTLFISSEEHALEKNYKRKKIFMTTIFLFLILGVSLFAYGKIQEDGFSMSSIKEYYYVSNAKRFVKKVQKKVEKGSLTCSDDNFVSGKGVYYVYYSDLSEAMFMPLNLFVDPISAYVKVDYSSGDVQYSVSVTDGTNGFKETLLEEVDISIVEEYTYLSVRNVSINTCHFS